MPEGNDALRQEPDIVAKGFDARVVSGRQVAQIVRRGQRWQSLLQHGRILPSSSLPKAVPDQLGRRQRPLERGKLKA
ncbi:hypothetical protein D3C83_205990 [compost metagenome]